MKAILSEIRDLSEGTEKDFLKRSVDNTKKYIKLKDKQSLELIISRLNGLFDGMTEKGQKISLKLIAKIMEEISKNE